MGTSNLESDWFCPKKKVKIKKKEVCFDTVKVIQYKTDRSRIGIVNQIK